MYSNEDLNSAVEAGIFSADSLEQFYQHIAQQRHSHPIDEEQFRLISGFNDIFVLIACSLLLISVGWIGQVIFNVPLGALLQALTAWLLAEYFIRIRHMALPSIILLVVFVGAVIFSSASFLLDLENPQPATSQLLIIFGCGCLAAWLHWQRFKVPITIAAGSASLVAGVIAISVYQFPQVKHYLNLLFFIAGLCVFLLAMYWDSSDRQRLTRRSDVAFWLHLLAAPLLIHPIFSLLNVFTASTSSFQAVAVATLYLLIAIVSISIDRRALMVSALAYVLYAFTSVLQQYGVVSLGFAFTSLIIGSGLLLLSVFWHSMRRQLLKHFPSRIQAWLPAIN